MNSFESGILVTLEIRVDVAPKRLPPTILLRFDGVNSTPGTMPNSIERTAGILVVWWCREDGGRERVRTSKAAPMRILLSGDCTVFVQYIRARVTSPGRSARPRHKRGHNGRFQSYLQFLSSTA
jgi:hypothetical protein